MPEPGCAAGQGFRTGSARCQIRGVTERDLDTLYVIATDPAVAPMLLLFSPGMSRAQFAGIFPPGADCPPFRAAVDMDGRTVGSIGVSAGARPSIVSVCSGVIGRPNTGSPPFCSQNWRIRPATQ